MVYLGVTVYTSLLGRLAEKGLEGLEEGEEEEQEGDGAMFIPFIGTTKEVPSKPYHGNDPEWQEFVSISQNAALVNRIKGWWYCALRIQQYVLNIDR